MGIWASSGTILSNAELYDPNAETFSATGSMSVSRQQHAATLLANGKVLVAGGQTSSGALVASAELYDPSTGAFTATGNMGLNRFLHSAVWLTNGKVLVLGGAAGAGGVSASAELYDPSTGTFSSTGSMTSPRYNAVSHRWRFSSSLQCHYHHDDWSSAANT